MNANDQETLAKLGSAEFDPEKTVIVNSAGVAISERRGADTTPYPPVEFVSYAPKRIQLRANAPAAAMLLLNDKYDPNWNVTVDGKPAPLLRANFTMRAVPVPPGQHLVEFRFKPPVTGLYVSLSAIGLGVLLIAALQLSGRRAGETPAVRQAGGLRYAG